MGKTTNWRGPSYKEVPRNIDVDYIEVRPVILHRRRSLLVASLLFSFQWALAGSSDCGSLIQSKPLITRTTIFLDQTQGKVLHKKGDERKLVQTTAGSAVRSIDPTTRSFGTRGGLSATRSIGPASEFSADLARAASESGIQLSIANNSDRHEIQTFILQARSEFDISPEGSNSVAVLDSDLNDISSNYTRRKGQLIILRQSGRIVGTAAIFQLDVQTAEIRKFYLASSLRSLGLGQLLLNHLIRKAKDYEYASLELETYSVMKKAIAFYTRNGFERFFPARIAHEEGVEAYRRTLRPIRPVVEESVVQTGYRQEFEDSTLNPFLHSIYENPEREGRFRYAVFEPFLMQEMRDNSETFKLYLELGITFQNGRFVFPPAHQMMMKYTQALRRRGIPEQSWILPSITYRRDAGSGVYEYRTIIPYLEPFPSEPGFQLIEKVPDAVFEYALRNGALPLSNFHDIHHFIAFLRSPEFMTKIKTAFVQLGDGPFTLGQRRRFTYALESLSLVSPQYKAETDEILKPLTQLPTLPLSQALFRNAPISQVVAVGQQIQIRLDGMLSHYSGIGMSKTETALELADYRKSTRVEDLIASLESPVAFDPQIEQNLPRNSFQEDPMYLSTKLQILLGAYSDGVRTPEIESAIRTIVMNGSFFMLHSSQHIGIDKWVDDMLGPQFSTNSETMQFIRQAFGEDSITYRMLAVP